MKGSCKTVAMQADYGTQDITRRMADAAENIMGRPHVILMHLHRLPRHHVMMAVYYILGNLTGQSVMPTVILSRRRWEILARKRPTMSSMEWFKNFRKISQEGVCWWTSMAWWEGYLPTWTIWFDDQKFQIFVSAAQKSNYWARLRAVQPPDLAYCLGQQPKRLISRQSRLLCLQTHYWGWPGSEGVHGRQQQPRRLSGGRGLQCHTISEFTKTRFMFSFPTVYTVTWNKDHFINDQFQSYCEQSAIMVV